jgi:endonuclease YncB( thermonuclease family)
MGPHQEFVLAILAHQVYFGFGPWRVQKAKARLLRSSQTTDTDSNVMLLRDSNTHTHRLLGIRTCASRQERNCQYKYLARQKFRQNLQIPRHIESLNVCMKH